MSFSDLNLAAVLAASVAAMVVGFIWYSPGVFGTKWMKLVGFKQKPSDESMCTGFALGFVASILTNGVLAMILAVVGPASVQEALKTAFVLWVGFMLTHELHAIAWEKRPQELLFINGGQALVSLLVSAWVLMLFV